jgi:hypothetical protein
MEILWMASAHDLRWGHFYGSTNYEGNLTPIIFRGQPEQLEQRRDVALPT